MAKSVLVPLGLTAAASAADTDTQKRIYGSSTTTLVFSNEWYRKKVKSLKESCLLINGVSKTIKNDVKEQKVGFLSMILGRLHASLLGYMLVRKAAIQAGEGVIRAGERHDI